MSSKSQIALLLVLIGNPGEVLAELVLVPGGELQSAIPVEVGNNSVSVPAYFLQDAPVTNAEFLRFVLHQPEWQRGNVVSIFADENYLSNWQGNISLGSGAHPEQPVTRVSWFAANAYCEWVGARLPTWYEWEYAAAASEESPDARSDSEWRQQILRWYAETGGDYLPSVRSKPANFHRVFDLHGLVWEWVDDFSSLLVIGDSREQGGADLLQFCGAGAISMEEKENYAVLMRVAMLSSLEARYTTKNVGFRCAVSAEAR